MTTVYTLGDVPITFDVPLLDGYHDAGNLTIGYGPGRGASMATIDAADVATLEGYAESREPVAWVAPDGLPETASTAGSNGERRVLTWPPGARRVVWRFVRTSWWSHAGIESSVFALALVDAGTDAPVAASAPTLEAPIVGDGTVGLTWSAPASDGGSTITDYAVYRGTTPGTEALLSNTGGPLSYDDATVTNGTTYYYKVAAINGAGTGAQSNEEAATPAVSYASFAGSDLYVYGHSYTVDPGIRCTAGSEFYKTVATRHAFDSVTTYGVSSSRLIQLYHDVVGQCPQTPKTGSTWTPSRSGVAIVDCESNDAYNYDGSSTCVGLTTKAVGNYGDTLRAVLAFLSAASRAEAEAGTTSGTWTHHSADARWSNSDNLSTIAQNAYIDIPITAESNGVAYVITYIFSGTSKSGAFDVLVDGVVATSVAAGTGLFEQEKTARGSATYTIGVQVTKLEGLSAGAHTIRVKKTDADTAAGVYVDCVLPQSDTPSPILVILDPDTRSDASSPSAPATSGNRATFMANLDLLDPKITMVVGEFANAELVAPAWVPTTHLSAIDGLHPIDAGMDLMADAIGAVLNGI